MRASKKSQSGRSLLEMLMVLSVMAILTIGGVAGYKTLSTRFITRTVSEAITHHVVQRQHEAMGKLGRQEHKQENVEGPHGVRFDISNDTTNQLIGIKIKSENSDLIKSLRDSELLKGEAYSIDEPVLGGAESYVVVKFKQYQYDGIVPDSAITCSVGTVGGTGDATVRASDGTTPCYCEDEKRFVDGECVATQCQDVTNYSNDGLQLEVDQVCCTSEYSSAVGGVCCKDSEPYCFSGEYLQSTGTQWIDTGVYPKMDNFGVEIKAVKDTEYSLMGAGLRGVVITGVSGYNYYYYNNSVQIGKYQGSSDVKTLKIENNAFYVDGELAGTGPALVSTTYSAPICLFGRCTSVNSIDDSGSHKIYYVKLWNNGNLVRDMIPAIDKNGKAGMYDKVNDVMYYNQGSGKFLMSKSSSTTCKSTENNVINYSGDGSKIEMGDVCCPNGYSLAVGGTCCKDDAPYCKEVNYLESSGTQWIDTGVYPKMDNFGVEIKAVKDTEYSLMGAGSKGVVITGVSGYNYYYYNNSVQIGKYQGSSDVKTLKIENNAFYVDGELAGTGPALVSTTYSAPICLFGRCTSVNSIDDSGSHKIYYVKLWNNGNLVRDMIPVIDKSGRAGMYDKVGGQMYYSPNGNKFSAG